MLDAKDLASVVSELADVKEVIDALISRLGVPTDELTKAQVAKRQARGGFADGTQLVETQSVLPTSRHAEVHEPHLIVLQPDATTDILDEAELRRRSESIEKRTDRRVAPGRTEIRITAQVPVTRTSSWTALTATERIPGGSGKLISGRVKGSRVGSQWHVELSVRVDEAQPEYSSGHSNRGLQLHPRRGNDEFVAATPTL